MLSRRQFIAASAGVAATAAVPRPARAADPAVHIGMLQGMFRDVNPAVVQAMANPLRTMIAQQTGLSGDVGIVPDARTLADKMRAGAYQLGVFHGFEFAWVGQTNPELLPLVVTVPPARVLRAVVVVLRTSAAKALADLKDEVVLVPRGTKAHCLLYMDAQKAGLPAATAALKTKPALTSEEALDEVVQGNAAAAVVDASALLGYQKLAPGAWANLKALCESDPFPPTVIAVRKDALPDATVDRVRAMLTAAHQTPAGKPLMMMWNLKGFEAVPADFGDQLAAVSKRYPAPAANAYPGAQAQAAPRPDGK